MDSRTESKAPMSKTVLIVDNDPYLPELLRELLAEEGYTSTWAQSGAEAEDLVTSARPDVVLLDYLLPDTTGDELCQRLRKLPNGADVPVILVTGHPSAAIRECNEFALVRKPFELDDLLDVVARAVAS